MLRKILLSCSLLAAFSFVALPAGVGAVDVFKDVCGSNNLPTDEDKRPTVCKEKDAQRQPGADGEQQNPIFGKKGILTTIIKIVTIAVGIIAVVVIMLAGLKFVTANGNAQEVNNAREMIIFAAVGLVIVAVGQIIVKTILEKIGT